MCTRLFRFIQIEQTNIYLVRCTTGLFFIQESIAQQQNENRKTIEKRKMKSSINYENLV